MPRPPAERRRGKQPARAVLACAGASSSRSGGEAAAASERAVAPGARPPPPRPPPIRLSKATRPSPPSAADRPRGHALALRHAHIPRTADAITMGAPQPGAVKSSPCAVIRESSARRCEASRRQRARSATTGTDVVDGSAWCAGSPIARRQCRASRSKSSPSAGRARGAAAQGLRGRRCEHCRGVLLGHGRADRCSAPPGRRATRRARAQAAPRQRTARPVTRRTPTRRAGVEADRRRRLAARAASASRRSPSISRCAGARWAERTGLLDADIYGPSLPRMLGLNGQARRRPTARSCSRWRPAASRPCRSASWSTRTRR